MRGRGNTWDSWDENHLFRRDVRQDHGSGPEELPHKKKAKPKKRIKHEHKWAVHRIYEWSPRWIFVKCEICGKDEDKFED